MKVRKTGTAKCCMCKGTGKLEFPKGLHPGAPDKCFDCDGYGYRIIVKNDEGIERHVTKEDYDHGIIKVYFPS